MKKLFTLIFIVFTMHSEAKETGGGVIVGNGAGFAEGLFQQSYQSLSVILESFANIQDSTLSTKEKDLLEKIVSVAKRNKNKKDRLLFVSEKDHPDFFKTGENEIHRFAKTYEDINSPIFINIDWIYTDAGKKLLNYSSAMALIIHEIGHQVGEESHVELDILGSKVKEFSDGQSNQYNFHINAPDREKTSISFLITNLELPKKNTLMRFKNEKNQWSNLTPALVNNLKCTKRNTNLFEFEVNNGHFAFNQYQQLEFRAWIEFSCQDEFSDEVFTSKKTIIIKLDQEFEINGLILE